MYGLEYSSRFRKDFKKIARMSVEDVVEVGGVISRLQRAEPLDARHRDHPLAGNWNGFRDCHIKPDLVLIYRVADGVLQLARIGTHSDLF